MSAVDHVEDIVEKCQLCVLPVSCLKPFYVVYFTHDVIFHMAM